MKVWDVGPGMLAMDLGKMKEQAKEVHPSIGGRLLRSVVEGERDGDVGKIVLRDGISSW